MARRQRRDIDLIWVHWDPEDYGLVSFRRRETLVHFYCGRPPHGLSFCACSTIARVEITDADFEILGKGMSDSPDWDQVCSLLACPRFPLMQRINRSETHG